VDLVTFSGDKLLGGPQAGIIAGRSKLVERLKREPFFRALRCDKLVLSALQATADDYLCGRVHELPIVKMLAVSNDELLARAEKIISNLGKNGACTPGKGTSQIGGGTLPRSVVPSVTLDVSVPDLPLLAARLRSLKPPIVGYIAGRRFKLDLRTVFPAQDELVTSSLLQALKSC
jgi:L-seryl-tRNA(Ser) seleniumtransferase